MSVNPLKRLLGYILSFFYHKQIHAFKVQLDGRTYYVCARCSGFYLGIILGFPISFAMLLFFPIFYSLGPIGTTIIAVGLALPAMLDWSTQRLALRESRNALRFGTGLPAGFSLIWYLVSPNGFILKIPVFIGVLIFLIVFGKIDRRTLPKSELEEDYETELERS
ncbi:MAG: DUF2085 domain-containing protein [Promethearchaeota archaeon]